MNALLDIGFICSSDFVGELVGGSGVVIIVQMVISVGMNSVFFIGSIDSGDIVGFHRRGCWSGALYVIHYWKSDSMDSS